MIKIDLSSEEKMKELYETFDSFKTRKEIFEYLGLARNSKNIKRVKEICNDIGFDYCVYDSRKQKYNEKYCLNCGKKIESGDYRKKFCTRSCASIYNGNKNKKNATIKNEPNIDENISFEKRTINGNNKNIGEIGERIAIGELAKYGIDVLLPMSDNLPYDFVIDYNNKFYKCQVKSSNHLTKYNGIFFSLVTNNWYSRKEKIYTDTDVDIFICCDMSTIYLFKYDELIDKKGITIRYNEAKNNQTKGIKFAADYVISNKRINEVLN